MKQVQHLRAAFFVALRRRVSFRPSCLIRVSSPRHGGTSEPARSRRSMRKSDALGTAARLLRIRGSSSEKRLRPCPCSVRWRVRASTITPPPACRGRELERERDATRVVPTPLTDADCFKAREEAQRAPMLTTAANRAERGRARRLTSLKQQAQLAVRGRVAEARAVQRTRLSAQVAAPQFHSPARGRRFFRLPDRVRESLHVGRLRTGNQSRASVVRIALLEKSFNSTSKSSPRARGAVQASTSLM